MVAAFIAEETAGLSASGTPEKEGETRIPNYSLVPLPLVTYSPTS